MAKQSVYDAWIDFNKNKEGYLNYMYVDQKNLVTTGMGNLIENTSTGNIQPAALSYGWKRADGNPASQSEIIAEFNNMKNAGLANTGGGNQKSHTTLHLDDSAVKAVITTALKSFETTIRQYFPSYDSWPADAQMGILSMAWALGPAFAPKYPKFTAAANQLLPDFVTMAAQSLIPELGTGDGGRNQDNVTLFTNAANVLASNADPDNLYWPGMVISSAKKGIIAVCAGFFAVGFGLVGWDWVTDGGKTKVFK